MSTTARHDAWSAGEHYERYMGRWSRQIATRYLDWLGAPKDAAWLDLGCGTGALTQTILAKGEPRSIVAIDQSADFVAHARAAISDEHVRMRFEVGGCAEDPARRCVGRGRGLGAGHQLRAGQGRGAARDEARGEAGRCCVSFYVWDYPGGGMGFMSAFWNAAIALDPKAAELGEGRRFPFCTPDGLSALCAEAGWPAATVAPIEIEARFGSFEDYWQPFTLGAGPAPGYCVSLPDDKRAALKARLKQDVGGDGPVSFVARAWAVKARA